MKHLVMSAGAKGHVVLAESERPAPQRDEALVKVTAFSMNRGELMMAADPAADGRRIGWDFAGVVEQAAADGSSPEAGARVVGWRPAMDAWAEYVVSPASYLAVIPEQVSDAQAAALPVAGLTALAALDRGSRLLGSDVLVTGVTGGVGGFAARLAALAGARVTAQVRHDEQRSYAQGLGAHEVVVTEDGAGLAHHGPYRLVVDGVGGALFGALPGLVGKGGTLVSYGVTAGQRASLDLHSLFGAGGQRTLYGLTLYTEVEHHPAADGLARLLRLVAAKELDVDLGVECDWQLAPDTAQDLLDRQFTGKAVLTVGT